MPVVEVQGDLDQRIRAANGKLVVVDFFAEWCGPCRQIAPIYHQLSDEFRDVVFLTVNEASNRDLISQAGVRGFPTFHFYVSGSKVDELVGGNPHALRAKIEEHRAKAAPSFAGSGHSLGGGGASLSAAEAREARLRRLGGGSGGAGQQRAAGTGDGQPDPALAAALAASLSQTCDPNTGVCGMAAAPAAAPAPAPAPATATATTDSGPTAALRRQMTEELGFPEHVVDAAIASGCADAASVVEFITAHEGEVPAATAAPAAVPAPTEVAAPSESEQGGAAAGEADAAREAAEDEATLSVQMAEHEAAQVAANAAPMTEEEREVKMRELKQKLAEARRMRKEAEKRAEREREMRRREEGKKKAQMRDQLEAVQRKRDMELRRREEREAHDAKARARRMLLVDKYERLVEKCRREGAEPPTLQTYLDSNGKVKRAGQTLEEALAEGKAKHSPEERAQGAIKRLLEYRVAGEGVRGLKTCRILIKNALEKDDPKYRCVKMDNEKIKSTVIHLIGGITLMQAAGFSKNTDARTLEIGDDADKDRLRSVLDIVEEALRHAGAA